ncbi:MAG: hypothetical protein IPF48_02800 [Sphingomonadales bacterium]|nr:hypothetical protein [Sphingomonadales bacterium]
MTHLTHNVFPNISPWGCFNPIFYRLACGDNPEECVRETMLMLPIPKGEERPARNSTGWI